MELKLADPNSEANTDGECSTVEPTEEPTSTSETPTEAPIAPDTDSPTAAMTDEPTEEPTLTPETPTDVRPLEDCP